MKKSFIRLLALCVLCSCILNSCVGRSPGATDLLFDALDALGSFPAYEIFYSGAPEYSESLLNTEHSELLYRDKNMASYAESFAIALGKDDELWELHVFVALSAGDAGFIENALIRRLDILQTRDIYIYDPEIYEKRVQDARVLRHGRVVCLSICDDNSRVLGEIKKSVK